MKGTNPASDNPSKVEALYGDRWRARREPSNSDAQLVVLSVRRLSVNQAYQLTHDLIFSGPVGIALAVRWQDQREIPVNQGKQRRRRDVIGIRPLIALERQAAQVTERYLLDLSD